MPRAARCCSKAPSVRLQKGCEGPPAGLPSVRRPGDSSARESSCAPDDLWWRVVASVHHPKMLLGKLGPHYESPGNPLLCLHTKPVGRANRSRRFTLCHFLEQFRQLLQASDGHMAELSFVQIVHRLVEL